jgi:DegV family protein with EDD domain
MASIHLVGDSSCDLDPAEIAGLDIEIVPLSIRFGSEEFTDGLDLSLGEFYQRMASSDGLPQTACPAPGAFVQAFRNAEDAGADAVVCVTLSGELSNTLQSAQSAVDAYDGRIPVHVIDSRSVSSGLGTLLLEAAKVADGDAGVDSVLARIGDLVPRTRVFAALNTLENLKKGGRIGGARAMVGSMLSIKPLVDLTGGVVREAGKPRTRRKALHMLYERMTEAGPIDHVAVMHGGAPDIDEFLDLIAPRFPRTSLRVGTLGAVIGTHGGAEIIGASWIDRDQEA